MSGKAVSDSSEIVSPIAKGCQGASVELAKELFMSLAPMHHLTEHDFRLLSLAADLHSCHAHLSNEATSRRVILQATAATLPARDQLVVEAVLDLSRHSLGYDSGVAWSLVPDVDRNRALWLTALVRLAEAACVEFGGRVEGFYVTWTDTVLYVEFDGAGIGESGLRAVRGRCAALEVVSGRRVVLTCSCARRSGAA